MQAKFQCHDSYEAEKLSSMFALQKDDSIFVKEIVNIIDNEAIINLKDGSHHSILFKDNSNAVLLKDFFRQIISNNKKVVSTDYSDDEAVINLK